MLHKIKNLSLRDKQIISNDNNEDKNVKIINKNIDKYEIIKEKDKTNSFDKKCKTFNILMILNSNFKIQETLTNIFGKEIIAKLNSSDISEDLILKIENAIQEIQKFHKNQLESSHDSSIHQSLEDSMTEDDNINEK